MRRFPGTDAITSRLPDVVLTIGNFDGMHLGHQMILREVAARARTLGGTSVVMTFDPPPGRVLGKQFAPQVMTLEDRAAMAEQLGVDVFVTQPFTAALAQMTPVSFVEDILLPNLDLRGVMVGYDFCFGRDRSGDIHFLRGYFGPRSVDVYQFGQLSLNLAEGDAQEAISSSAVRRRVLAGQVSRAAHMLGRPHFVRGPVVTGDQRGRTIGFPTANVASVTELVPAVGVYATWLALEGRLWPSVTNVGLRPTFQGQDLRVECHILDFEGDIYGREVSLQFVERIRGEQRFASIEALKAQIAQDVMQARRLLSLPASEAVRA